MGTYIISRRLGPDNKIGLEQLRRHIGKSFELSEEDWLIFSSKLTRQEISRKSSLLIAGQIENYLSFIEKGIIRLYIPGDESEVTFGFSFDNEFVSAYDSFLTRTPSAYTVEALTNTVVWCLTYADLQMIYKETGAGNEVGRLASEGLFLKKSARELSLLSDTAEQRYRKLFTDRPDVIKEIPLKYIASYIGITPQALSRIRKRIS